MKPNDITLSSGRTFTHDQLHNQSWNIRALSGPDEMTDAEWIEYVGIVRQQSKPLNQKIADQYHDQWDRQSA